MKTASPPLVEEPTHSSFWNRMLRFAMRTDYPNAPLSITLFLLGPVTLFVAFYHVPWRDEAQAWLFARDLDIYGLFIEARHDGHPILWWLCLKVIQATGSNYLGMMVLNWLFFVSGIWLLFYRSDLPLAARVGVALAPICIGEIAFTGRDYAIAIPLCFLAAILYKRVQEKPVLYSVALALFGNTNGYAFAVFAGISFQFLLEQAFGFGKASFSLRPLFTTFLGANLILFLGALFLVLQLAPIQFYGDHIPRSISTLAPSMGHLLNRGVIFVFLMLSALMFFSRKAGQPRILGVLPIILISAISAYACGCVGRHAFMLALGVIYFCWIYLDDFIEAGVFCGTRLNPTAIKILVTFLIIVASFEPKPINHLNRKLAEKLFDSRAAANAIIEKNLDRPDTLLVATDPFGAMSLLLYFKNIHVDYSPPEFGVSPQSYTQATYLKYYNLASQSLSKIRPLVLDIARKNPTKTILVAAIGGRGSLDFPVDDPDYRLISIYQSPDSIRDESYHIYVLKTGH